MTRSGPPAQFSTLFFDEFPKHSAPINSTMNHKWQKYKYNFRQHQTDQHQTSTRPAADPQHDGGHLE